MANPPGFQPLGFTTPTLSFDPAILTQKRDEFSNFGIVVIEHVRDYSPRNLKARLQFL